MSMFDRDGGRFITEGKHKGFQYCVLHNMMGYRCGYVFVSKDHPWYGLDDLDFNTDIVHGGVTYSEPEGGGWVVGFDCAHVGDQPDPDLIDIVDPARDLLLGTIGNVCDSLLGVDVPVGVKSTEYVVGECKKLCEKAKEAMEAEVDIYRD